MMARYAHARLMLLVITLLISAPTESSAATSTPRSKTAKAPPTITTPTQPSKKYLLLAGGYLGFQTGTLKNETPAQLSGIDAGATITWQQVADTSHSSFFGLAGIGLSSLSAKQSSANVNLSFEFKPIYLRLGGGMSWSLTKTILVNGLISFDYGLSGNGSGSADRINTDFAIVDMTRFALGPGLTYRLGPTLDLTVGAA